MVTAVWNYPSSPHNRKLPPRDSSDEVQSKVVEVLINEVKNSSYGRYIRSWYETPPLPIDPADPRYSYPLSEEGLEKFYKITLKLFRDQERVIAMGRRLKRYIGIKADYEAPIVLPRWCRCLYDLILDFFYHISSFSLEKWVFLLLLVYFLYVHVLSFLYPLFNVVRRDFLHPRFFIKPPRWFFDENRLNIYASKFVFFYNFFIILLLVVFFLFYVHEGVLLVQYYDCYAYYEHLYHTVPYSSGGSSRRNGGLHTDLGWKKRLRHPERSIPSGYLLYIKDRW